jgi:hypothetical protein
MNSDGTKKFAGFSMKRAVRAISHFVKDWDEVPLVGEGPVGCRAS